MKQEIEWFEKPEEVKKNAGNGGVILLEPIIVGELEAFIAVPVAAVHFGVAEDAEEEKKEEEEK